MHSTIYKCHHCRYLIYKSFKDIFPFALIFSWIEILQKLVISDDSFLAQTTKSSIYKNEWLYTVSNTLYDLSHLLIYFMASYFVASLVWRGLSNQTKESFSASLLGFATVWLLLTSVVPGTDYHYPSQPIWLMLALISYLFIFLTRLLQNRHHIFQYSMLAILLLISSILSHILYRYPNIDLEYLIQNHFSQWLGDRPHQLIPIMLWSILAIFLTLSGLFVPDILFRPYSYFSVVSENLNAALSQHTDKIPYLYTFYTVKNSFAMFGGIGILLSLFLAVLYESRKLQSKNYYKLTLLTLTPLIFDQNLPFLVGLPVILQPILFIPMVLTTIFAEAFGALMLYLKFVDPAVYTVPSGTPSLLFGFLASNGDWRYLPVTAIILVVGFFIYRPFVKIAFAKEEQYEKIT